MLRDNLVELIEPMLNSAGANPLALTHHQIQASGDRLPCLENPRPKGAQSSLTENAPSPFQAEPAHVQVGAKNRVPLGELLVNARSHKVFGQFLLAVEECRPLVGSGARCSGLWPKRKIFCR